MYICISLSLYIYIYIYMYTLIYIPCSAGSGRRNLASCRTTETGNGYHSHNVMLMRDSTPKCTRKTT